MTWTVGWLGAADADELFDELMADVEWEQPTITSFGTAHLTPRLSKWFGDVAYTYSGARHEALPMPTSVDGLRRRLGSELGLSYNSVLVNLYRDGRDTVGMHADNEPELGAEPIIPTVVLGATRDFAIRTNATGERWLIPAAHGDLLLMGAGCQSQYTHGIPRRAHVSGPRISLTFRLVHANS